jgi:hypothetical protein
VSALRQKRAKREKRLDSETYRAYGANRAAPNAWRFPQENGEVKCMTPFSLEEIMRVTRYHEAGHAVAAYHHGYLITGVTVSDEVCKTYFRRPIFDGWADSWREACVTMAGSLADQCAMWGEMRPVLWAEFLAEAEAELEVVEDGEDWLRGDHSDLLPGLYT